MRLTGLLDEKIYWPEYRCMPTRTDPQTGLMLPDTDGKLVDLYDDELQPLPPRRRLRETIEEAPLVPRVAIATEAPAEELSWEAPAVGTGVICLP